MFDVTMEFIGKHTLNDVDSFCPASTSFHFTHFTYPTSLVWLNSAKVESFLQPMGSVRGQTFQARLSHKVHTLRTAVNSFQ